MPTRWHILKAFIFVRLTALGGLAIPQTKQQQHHIEITPAAAVNRIVRAEQTEQIALLEKQNEIAHSSKPVSLELDPNLIGSENPSTTTVVPSGWGATTTEIYAKGKAPTPTDIQMLYGGGVADGAKAKGQSGRYAELMRGENVGSEFLDPTIVMELRCFHCVMTEAKRDYIVSEGTLLAAARDGFLLPWDTDGDIVVDSRGGDYESFFKLFSPGPNSTASLKCPKLCREMQLNLFVDPFQIDGVEMHYYQSYNDILSGNVVERYSERKRQAPKELHQRLLKNIYKEGNHRFFRDGSQSVREGGSYLDVAFYHLHAPDANGTLKATIGGDPPEVISTDALLPIIPCAVKNFGAAGIETLSLSCPSRPRVYLDSYLPGGWSKDSYNKWDDSERRWVYDPNAPNLEQFLRLRHNYMGPLDVALEYKPWNKRVFILSFSFVVISFLFAFKWVGWFPMLTTDRAKGASEPSMVHA